MEAVISALLKCADDAYRKGYANGTSGNISFRTADDAIYISRTRSPVPVHPAGRFHTNYAEQRKGNPSPSKELPHASGNLSEPAGSQGPVSFSLCGVYCGLAADWPGASAPLVHAYTPEKAWPRPDYGRLPCRVRTAGRSRSAVCPERGCRDSLSPWHHRGRADS